MPNTSPCAAFPLIQFMEPLSITNKFLFKRNHTTVFNHFDRPMKVCNLAIIWSILFLLAILSSFCKFIFHIISHEEIVIDSLRRRCSTIFYHPHNIYQTLLSTMIHFQGSTLRRLSQKCKEWCRTSFRQSVYFFIWCHSSNNIHNEAKIRHFFTLSSLGKL